MKRSPPETKLVKDMPQSVRVSILPEHTDRGEREHPDVRLARRARTIANLARVMNARYKSGFVRRYGRKRSALKHSPTSASKSSREDKAGHDAATTQGAYDSAFCGWGWRLWAIQSGYRVVYSGLMGGIIGIWP